MSHKPSSKEMDKQLTESPKTDWALERTRLAKERTLAAWLRTGLTIIAAGFAIAKFIQSDEPLWITRSIGILFILLGGATFGLAFYNYYDLVQKFRKIGQHTPMIWMMGLLTVSLMLGAVAALVLVFIE